MPGAVVFLSSKLKECASRMQIGEHYVAALANRSGRQCTSVVYPCNGTSNVESYRVFCWVGN